VCFTDIAISQAPEEYQYTISRESFPNCYKMIVRHGYNERIVTQDLASLICAKLLDFINSGNGGSVAVRPTQDGGSASSSDISQEAEALERAFQTQVLYIVGKEQLKVIHPHALFLTNFFRGVVLNMFIWVHEVTRSKVQEMKVPIDRLVEVGFIKEM
jgi:KUP system potassium uptake protein